MHPRQVCTPTFSPDFLKKKNKQKVSIKLSQSLHIPLVFFSQDLTEVHTLTPHPLIPYFNFALPSPLPKWFFFGQCALWNFQTLQFSSFLASQQELPTISWNFLFRHAWYHLSLIWPPDMNGRTQSQLPFPLLLWPSHPVCWFILLSWFSCLSKRSKRAEFKRQLVLLTTYQYYSWNTTQVR